MIVDGRVYTLKALLEHCRELSLDANIPAWRREVFSFIRMFLDPSVGEITQRTSGSTGKPKAYLFHREGMAGSARRTLQFFDLRPGDRALLCLPVEYVAGKMMVVRALMGGLDLVLAEPSGRPLRQVEGPFAFGAMVPLQVYESLHSGDDLSTIGKLLIGGGALHPALKERLSRMEPPELFESFAMTETYSHFALKRLNGPSPDRDFRLLSGVFARTDHRGCLVVEIPGVTRGEVVTNDLVELSADGMGFRWLGRIDHVINSGGVKVIPEVVEEAIQALIGYPCLLLPEKDEKLGERLVLLVECADREDPDGAWEGLMREHLAPYLLPRRVVVVPGIPRNSSMKPDRIRARALL